MQTEQNLSSEARPSNYIGTLKISVERAMNLPQGLFGNAATIDPYLKLRLDDSEEVQKGSVKEKAGNDPIFNETFNFDLQGGERGVHVEIWDETIFKNVELASVFVRIDDLIHCTETKAESFDLHAKDEQAGKIILRASFVGNSPEGKWPRDTGLMSGTATDQNLGGTKSDFGQSSSSMSASVGADTSGAMRSSNQGIGMGTEVLQPGGDQSGAGLEYSTSGLSSGTQQQQQPYASQQASDLSLSGSLGSAQGVGADQSSTANIPVCSTFGKGTDYQSAPLSTSDYSREKLSSSDTMGQKNENQAPIGSDRPNI